MEFMDGNAEDLNIEAEENVTESKRKRYE